MSQLTETDPTRRFTSRVDNYARYRPRYPQAVLDTLRDECGLTPASAVADVGSGTGILTEMLLQNGNMVYAVEPNEGMRLAAEDSLRGYAGFISVNGRAEATTLPDASVDLVTAAQAFHWFDPGPARAEFIRILHPGGFVALVWNMRHYQSGGFALAYEALLGEHGQAYHQVNHAARVDNNDILFANGRETRIFAHERRLDYDALQGGLLSASYAPLPGSPEYEPMIARLRAIFDEYQQDGVVTMPYETHLYFARL